MIALGEEMKHPVRVPDTSGRRGTTPARNPAASDAALVAAALRDLRAFDALYERYFDPIHAYCSRRLTPDDAADATSQTFINVLHGLSRYRFDPNRPGSSFRSWLFSIAHNVVIDVYRHRGARREVHAPFDDDTTLADPVMRLPDTGPSPEEIVIAAESRNLLARLLVLLPERQRVVIEFRLAGLAHAEIAGALGLSSTAVRSAQLRGFRTLRVLLQDHDPDRDPDHREARGARHA